MPFSIIQFVLGAGFALVWTLIAIIVLRDGLLAARRENELDESGVATVQPTHQQTPHSRPRRNRSTASAA